MTMLELGLASSGGLAPSAWVTPGAVLDLDFVANRYWTDGEPGAFAGACARASTGWSASGDGNVGADLLAFAPDTARVVPGRGLLVEAARTNLFLDAAAPAGQTVSVASGVTHSVTVWGEWSVTVAGALAGTASEGAPGAGVTGSTSLVLTVAGAVGHVNVEAAAFGLSPIVTAGAPVERTAETVSLGDLGWLADNMTWLVEWEGYPAGSGAERALFVLCDGTDTSRFQVVFNASGNIVIGSNVSGAWGGGPSFGGHDDGGLHRMAVAYDRSAGTFRYSVDGAGASESGGNTMNPAAALTVATLGTRLSTGPANGFLRRLAAFDDFADAATLEELSA